MLFESFEFILTPSTPLARKYGFLYQSISLKHRYKRCRKAWAEHLFNCQNLFVKTITPLPKTESVVVLGSAHLHEIPLPLLLKNFKEVTLVDVIHPLRMHMHVWSNPRLKLVTADLSGALADLDKVTTYQELLNMCDHLASTFAFHFEADLIISANLLSQLALLPIEHVERKIQRKLTLEEKDALCTRFAEAHLNSLRKCKGHVLAYCDREVIYRNPAKEIIYSGHYPVDFAGFKKLKSWLWNIAPLGEAAKDYSIEMKIEAYEATF
jgi:hypothetical protein